MTEGRLRRLFRSNPAGNVPSYHLPVTPGRPRHHGVVLGAIQVAGDKKPLVLMADRQPTGGYPKLGHVARADIGRLAQMRPGETCRFRAASVAEARAALLRREDEIATTQQRLRPLRRALTSESLFEANLIDGVVDPLDSERTREECQEPVSKASPSS